MKTKRRSIQLTIAALTVASVIASASVASPHVAPAAPREGPSSKPVAPGSLASLRDPSKKEIAMQLVSAAENSSLDWKAQYAYIEYNVEGNDTDNRGYTGGIIGFTSKTHDMLELVEYYESIWPGNGLVRYIAALQKVDGTPSRKGLGKAFERAWKKEAAEPKFREAQDHLRDKQYFDPAVDQAIRDGLGTLGQFIYYDAIVMHGGGDDTAGFPAIRDAALKVARTPAEGGDQITYLNALLDARKAAMKSEEAHTETSRVDTMQRTFLLAGNLDLNLPLTFTVNSEKFTIPAPKKK